MPVYNYWVGVFTQSRMGNEDVEACDEWGGNCRSKNHEQFGRDQVWLA